MFSQLVAHSHSFTSSQYCNSFCHPWLVANAFVTTLPDPSGDRNTQMTTTAHYRPYIQADTKKKKKTSTVITCRCTQTHTVSSILALDRLGSMFQCPLLAWKSCSNLNLLAHSDTKYFHASMLSIQQITTATCCSELLYSLKHQAIRPTWLPTTSWFRMVLQYSQKTSKRYWHTFAKSLFTELIELAS